MATFPLRIVTGPEPATPCDSCTAGCCRNFAVPLTASDIQRIIGERGVAFGDFVCGWGEEQGRIGGGNVPQFYFKDAPGVPFVIAITPRPSQLYPGTRKCPFLREDGPLAGGSSCRTSCSIYASRPSVCRVFPFHRDAAGQVKVSPDLEARSKEQKPPYTLCPTQWTLTDEQRERVARDLKLLRAEMLYLTQLAEIWNRNPGRWAQFPAFLSAACEQATRAKAA